jgi:hypothetical protein
LLIYLVDPFLLAKGDHVFLRHQNFSQTLIIADVLDRLGYVVDVVDYRDELKGLHQQYNLIISHRIRLEQCCKTMEKAAIRIYLAAGQSHRFSNMRVRKRFSALAERREYLSAEPFLLDENFDCIKEFHATFAFGNEYTADTWRRDLGGCVYGFNNTGFPSINLPERVFGEARKNFLFFGGSHQVRKGLDLLLEVFPGLSGIHLYVCGNYDKEHDFRRIYRKELFATPNIHPIGFIFVDSAAFRRITEQCAFAIHPACSEGQAGSVIQCMHAGLIPIVSRETGIDVDRIGYLLQDDSLETLRDAILSVSSLPPEVLERQSLRVVETAKREYTEETFVRRWKEMLVDVHRRNNVPIPREDGV